MNLVRVEQFDFAALDVVNATAKLRTPGRIDLGLIHVHCLGIETAQAAVDHGSTVRLVKSEERLLNFRDVHGRTPSVRRGTDKQSLSR